MSVIIAKYSLDLISFKITKEKILRKIKVYELIVLLLLNIINLTFYVRLTIISLIFLKSFYQFLLNALIIYGVFILLSLKSDINQYYIIAIILFVLTFIRPIILDNKINNKEFININIDDEICEVFIDTGNFLTYEGLPVILTNQSKYNNMNIPYSIYVVGGKRKVFGSIKKIKINHRVIEVFLIYDHTLNFNYLGSRKLQEGAN